MLSSSTNSRTILCWLGVMRSPKTHRVRIAVAFLDVAEHLVVGAILFNDVNHVFENATVRPMRSGTGRGAMPGRGGKVACSITARR